MHHPVNGPDDPCIEPQLHRARSNAEGYTCLTISTGLQTTFGHHFPKQVSVCYSAGGVMRLGYNIACQKPAPTPVPVPTNYTQVAQVAHLLETYA